MPNRTYADFLHLDDVLGMITPSTPQDDHRVHAAEHFFLVAHQTSELWLKQVLLDLVEAVRAASAPGRDLEQAAQYVDRAAEVIRLLAAHVAALRRLTPADFAKFRPAFGNASGAQSVQFQRLQHALGLSSQPSPLYRELIAATAERRTSLEMIYRQAPHGGALYRLAESMADLSLAAWHWQVDHLDTVSRVIGRVPGTGGTSGANYLANHMEPPFPELWEARSRVHQRDGGTQCPH